VASELLYSVGHGSRPQQELLDLLERHAIDCLVDVRAYPRSKRHPQFSRLAIEASLAARGIRYVWEGAALGGMRRPRGDGPHVALADVAFRGYAEHMGSEAFAAGLARLRALAAHRRVAFMCAEVMPQHCHRGFIADALGVLGVQVLHLVGVQDTRLHAPHPALRVDGNRLVYDGGQQLALGF